MYEDLQFPIDVSGVQNDHPFLDADSLQSLFRRLSALNRCATMRIEHHSQHKHSQQDDSDEDNQCALSSNWQYERKSRRWSRVVDITPAAQRRLQAIAARALVEQAARAEDGESADDVDDDTEARPAPRQRSGAREFRQTPDRLTVPGIQEPCSPDPESEDCTAGGDEASASRFRRTGSERLRDGAKALLRRVESLKTRRRKRHNREGVIISSPQLLDVVTMNQRMRDLNCVDISPTSHFPYADFASSPSRLPLSPVRTQPPSPMATSPVAPNPPSFIGHLKISPIPPFGDDSSSYCSDGSQGSGNQRTSSRSKLGNRARKLLHRNIKADEVGAMSDSECQPASWRHHYFKDANSNNTKVVYVEPPSPVDPPSMPAIKPVEHLDNSSKYSPQRRQALRTGSLNLGKDSHKFRDKSFKRDKSASRSSELSESLDSGGSGSQQDDEAEDTPNTTAPEITVRQKSNVQRWHSFQRSSSLNSRPSAGPVILPTDLDDSGARQMSSLSCGQLHVLRKLALLRLTACMERYCPTHRSGWNWELPKFIRKIKTPDYKDKTVFGVPLSVSLQRTGHALPKPIQVALAWLKINALDQVGLFRKAGVRSRIARLRQIVEAAGATSAILKEGSSADANQSTISFDGSQAHDVADMVKQYFRELPDVLLTNKLSETFIAIFHHVPEHMRPDAVQCALLLLPEEHREALQAVLTFLAQVADHSATNQMTASNLAVCLAPTLLRLHHTAAGNGSTKEGNSNRSASVSPRRGAANATSAAAAATGLAGVPDARQLGESKAAHSCLLLLIAQRRKLFAAPQDMLARCRFNYFEESVPVALDELGREFDQNWQGFQQACIQALLKEAREKSRGWMTVSGAAAHVELCYRKVGDGHPLRLWRAATDVEAPPQEVMQRILRERHIWDDTLLKWRVVEKLGTSAEVFQYVTAATPPLPARDYCVLRSWQTGGGWCALAETSVQHLQAPVPGSADVGVAGAGARAVVLASRYLVEPAGKGRSRLVHLARVDTMGRTPEWYNKNYGHICALHLARIRASFKHNTEGPESNV